jgi:hypothetical protein
MKAHFLWSIDGLEILEQKVREKKIVNNRCFEELIVTNLKSSP